MKIPLFFALRYLKERKKASISVILGIAIGVAILISFLALTNGYRQSLVNRILGVESHIQVMSRHGGALYNYENNQKLIQDIEGVKNTRPLIYRTGLLQRGNYIHDVRLKGIKTSNPPEVEIKEGSWQTLETAGEIETEGASSNERLEIIIGDGLSKRVGAYPGDEITITFAGGISRTLKVGGIFDARLQQYNDRVAYISFANAQKIFDMGDRASMIAVEVEDPFKVREISDHIEDRTGYYSQNWQEANENLLTAMQLERRLFTIILVFILVVASFGMGNLLNMLVMEKEKEIGILMAMGSPVTEIKRVFLTLGMMMGTIGTALGIILGIIITYLLSRYPIQIPSDVYNVEYLQFQFQWQQFVLVAALTLAIVAAASFFPARNSTRFEVIEVLRNE